MEYFENNAHYIKDTYEPRIDYLKIVDQYIEEELKIEKRN